MNRPILVMAAVLAALFAGLPAMHSAGADPGRQPCEPVSFEGHTYTLCEAPLSRFDIRIFWRRPDGAPYGYLRALPAANKKGGRLAFALNGGMFHPDYSPVGLYIEEGRELVRANTSRGPGNFHLKPNGVFMPARAGQGCSRQARSLSRSPKRSLPPSPAPCL